MVVSSMHEHIDYIQVMLLYRRKEFMGSPINNGRISPH